MHLNLRRIEDLKQAQTSWGGRLAGGFAIETLKNIAQLFTAGSSSTYIDKSAGDDSDHVSQEGIAPNFDVNKVAYS